MCPVFALPKYSRSAAVPLDDLHIEAKEQYDCVVLREYGTSLVLGYLCAIVICRRGNFTVGGGVVCCGVVWWHRVKSFEV